MDPGSTSTKATRYAATMAIVYVVAAGLYIVLSGRIAAALASSLHDLESFERMKGIAFVLCTGLGLFVLARTLFARLLRSADDVARAREAQLRADRQALPGLLAASIAHDFKNVLTVIGASADLLADDPSPADRAMFLRDLRASAEQARALANDLSRAGRSSSAAGPARDLDVSTLVHDSVELMHHHPSARGRHLSCDLAPGERGQVYATLVQQIVSNLVVNGLEAAPAGGHVLVRVRREGEAIAIAVHDDGPGLDQAAAKRIFDPFYTTKEHGTGLGLVSVRSCAQLHGGDVEVERSEELGGACFRVTLRGAGSVVSPSGGATT
ncbi:MAG: HAMP domain-containing sensor histidine kinase [Sandaracinus sp.]